MTVSSRLTQLLNHAVRLKSPQRHIRISGVPGIATLEGPEWVAVPAAAFDELRALLPHLGAQEALPRSRSELKRRLAQGDPSVSESTVPLADQPPSSAGSSAVPPSQSRDVIGWLVVAAEALALVADDEVAGLPQRLRSHGHLNARDREALKRTKEMCDVVLRATAVVREQIGASSPPAVSGPWCVLPAAEWHEDDDMMGFVVECDGRFFDTELEAEAIAVRDALNRVAAQAAQEESR